MIMYLPWIWILVFVSDGTISASVFTVVQVAVAVSIELVPCVDAVPVQQVLFSTEVMAGSCIN